MTKSPEPTEPAPEEAPDQPPRDLLAGVRRTLGLDQGEGLQDTDARPAMVEFRTLKNGWVALPYKSLIEVSLDKAKEWPLKVKFSDREVSITGSNMEGLYHALVQQRALVVMQQDDRHELELWGESLDEDDQLKGKIFIAEIKIDYRSKGRSV